jgi:hypothetical protein
MAEVSLFGSYVHTVEGFLCVNFQGGEKRIYNIQVPNDETSTSTLIVIALTVMERNHKTQSFIALLITWNTATIVVDVSINRLTPCLTLNTSTVLLFHSI